MPISRSRQLEISKRRQQILEMAIGGATTRQISQSLSARGEKISHVQVAKDIKTVLGEMADGNKEGAETLRGIFNQRYERLLMRMWARAVGSPARRDERGEVLQDEIPADEFAVDRVLRILSEMRKMNGLDIDPQMGSEDNPLHMSIIELAKVAEQYGHERAVEDIPSDEEPKILLEGSVGVTTIQQTT